MVDSIEAAKSFQAPWGKLIHIKLIFAVSAISKSGTSYEISK